MQSGIERGAHGGLLFPVNLTEGNEMAASNDAEKIFERIKDAVEGTGLGSEVYSSWFGRMKLAEASKGVVRMSVPTAFLKSWINGHYLDLIAELWRQEEPDLFRIEIIVRSATRQARPTIESEPEPARKPVRPAQTALGSGTIASGKAEPSPAPRTGAAPAPEFRQGVLGSPLDQRYTFQSFVEGPSNRVALAAARAVAESMSRFNPLFLHATVGLGKTHLLQAIAAESLKQNPKSRVVYLTAEYFMWRFATAIRDNNALTLKEQLRDIDLLIIDDMQFLQGKSIQHEFCHLINMLLDSAKQVVVAADRPPAELESLEPRVRSRLNGGVALEMSAPDYTMRLGMLKLRHAIGQGRGPVDRHLGRDPRPCRAHRHRQRPRTRRRVQPAPVPPDASSRRSRIERIDEILGHIYRTGEPKRVRIEDIQRIVARHYNVSKTELLSNRRTRTIVKPRQIAMYLAKVMTPRSLPEIGRRFGGRDHTTVLHAVRKIEDLSGNDNTLAQELELLRRLINDQA